MNAYSLTEGGHTLTMAYREDGTKPDKLCLSNQDERSNGEQTVDLNGSDLASGLYLYRLQTPDFIQSKKDSPGQIRKIFLIHYIYLSLTAKVMLSRPM